MALNSPPDSREGGKVMPRDGDRPFPDFGAGSSFLEVRKLGLQELSFCQTPTGGSRGPHGQGCGACVLNLTPVLFSCGFFSLSFFSVTPPSLISRRYSWTF